MTAKQKANRERFKKVVAEAAKLRKKNPKLTQAQAVKQAWAISYGKSKKLGAKATLTKVKAKKGKKTSEMHTDTKSHNVNIRVVSGLSKYVQIIFTRYKLKFGKRVTKNTPLDIVVIGTTINNPEKFGKPIIVGNDFIYKGDKEKFNYGNEKGEQIRYYVKDDENYNKYKNAAKLSALTELF